MTQVTAYEDTIGRLHRTEREMAEANLKIELQKRVAEKFNTSRDVYNQATEDVLNAYYRTPEILKWFVEEANKLPDGLPDNQS